MKQYYIINSNSYGIIIEALKVYHCNESFNPNLKKLGGMKKMIFIINFSKVARKLISAISAPNIPISLHITSYLKLLFNTN